MGRGSYTAGDWMKLRSSFGNETKTKPLFAESRSAFTLSSLTGVVREARDNEDSPRSTPVIIGIDVTSSMGYLAEELALNSLNKAIVYLYDNKPIPCPQVMCCAIGDCKSDSYPLQVTQFESDIRIIKQLTELRIEGGGGGNGGESYNLAWYFAARRTRTDCYEQRRKKGCLITIGDDNCHRMLTRGEIKRVFGDDAEYDLSAEELIDEAEKMYHVFHICIDRGLHGDDRIFAGWREILPGRTAVINKRDISCLSELLYALISVGEGRNVNEALGAVNQAAAERIADSLAYISMPKTNSISF